MHDNSICDSYDASYLSTQLRMINEDDLLAFEKGQNTFS